jgi:hypothetical protein
LDVNRDEALVELAEMIRSTDLSLPIRRDANDILERATGRSVGWSANLPAGERARAAHRWTDAICASDER